MFGVRRLALAGACVAVAVLSACSSTSVNRAPVEDRGSSSGKPSAVIDPRTQVVKQPPGFENAGKAGYYTVKPGDTLMRIALETGQGHKDLARWNALDNPDKIEVGQVLRVVPPVADTVAVAKPVVASSATTTTLPAATAASSAASAPAKAASAPVAAPSAPSAPAPAAAAASGDDDLAWIWPGHGPVLTGFDEVKNKGLDIGGAAGDPVLAAGEGKVVYAGAGLRGYGNLIILKHNNTYLTAYAHNQALLVKEDQAEEKVGLEVVEDPERDKEITLAIIYTDRGRGVTAESGQV